MLRCVKSVRKGVWLGSRSRMRKLTRLGQAPIVLKLDRSKRMLEFADVILAAYSSILLEGWNFMAIIADVCFDGHTMEGF